VEMDITQVHTNTTESVYEQTLKYFQKESTDLLHSYIFDIPYKFSMVDYVTKKAIADIVCLEMECDFEVNDCMLEKISLHFRKRK